MNREATAQEKAVFGADVVFNEAGEPVQKGRGAIASDEPSGLDEQDAKELPVEDVPLAELSDDDFM